MTTYKITLEFETVYLLTANLLKVFKFNRHTGINN